MESLGSFHLEKVQPKTGGAAASADVQQQQQQQHKNSSRQI